MPGGIGWQPELLANLGQHDWPCMREGRVPGHGPVMARAVHVCARLCFWYHMYYNMIGGHGPVMARAGHVRGLFLFSRSRARCARLCSW